MNEGAWRLRKAYREGLREDFGADTSLSATAGLSVRPQCVIRIPQLACGAFLVFGIALAPLGAKSDETAGTGAGELSAYAGPVFGIGSHPAVGGSVGEAFSRYGSVLVDVSYMPLSNETLLSTPLTTSYRHSGLYDFDLCANLRVPVRKRWEAYGILGIGLLYNVYQSAFIGPTGTAFANHSKTNFDFSTGGGVRYYIRENWGIRPEVRVFISNRNFVRVAVGVFYDVGVDWPFRYHRYKKHSDTGRPR